MIGKSRLLQGLPGEYSYETGNLGALKLMTAVLESSEQSSSDEGGQSDREKTKTVYGIYCIGHLLIRIEGSQRSLA